MLPSALLVGGDFDYFDYPIRGLLFLPLIIGLRGHVIDRSLFSRAFFVGSSCGGIGAFIFSIKYLFIDHLPRVGLPITNPVAYGQIAAILALVAFASCFNSNKRWELVVSCLGFFGAVFAVSASGTGGALLGLRVGLFVELILFARIGLLRRMGRIFLIVALTSSFILLPLAQLKLKQGLSDIARFQVGRGMGTSQGQRLILWKIALDETSKSPWLGIGPGKFPPIIHKYCSLTFCDPGFSRMRGVHNQFFDVMVNSGLVGLLGLLISYIGTASLFFRCFGGMRSVKAVIAPVVGLATIACGMVSAFSQVLYGHNISVISYFFTITFLWFLSSHSFSSLPASSLVDARAQPNS